VCGVCVCVCVCGVCARATTHARFIFAPPHREVPARTRPASPLSHSGRCLPAGATPPPVNAVLLSRLGEQDKPLLAPPSSDGSTRPFSFIYYIYYLLFIIYLFNLLDPNFFISR
jgi:hypothetical protein